MPYLCGRLITASVCLSENEDHNVYLLFWETVLLLFTDLTWFRRMVTVEIEVRNINPCYSWRAACRTSHSFDAMFDAHLARYWSEIKFFRWDFGFTDSFGLSGHVKKWGKNVEFGDLYYRTLSRDHGGVWVLFPSALIHQAHCRWRK